MCFYFGWLEAIPQKYSIKKVILEILQNSQENTRARISILKKLQALLKKRLWYTCFLVSFAKILRTPFITEHLRWLLLEDIVSKLVYLSGRSWPIFSQLNLNWQDFKVHLLVLCNPIIFPKYGICVIPNPCVSHPENDCCLFWGIWSPLMGMENLRGYNILLSPMFLESFVTFGKQDHLTELVL